MLLPFRREANVDARIRRLSNKELIRDLNKKHLSADDCKQLGDLYLQKGDKRRAIVYLYKAAEILSVDHMNKALAVYKKILHISPAEIEACEKIISILSGEGLIAEQTKYLLIAAHYYESRNDVRNTASVFRRILDIDPDNATAGEFFSRGKADRK